MGIDIYEPGMRGRGIATVALGLFIEHLRACGEARIFAQTWSGNVRMLALARKLGFEGYLRKPGVRTVRGEAYDGLAFELLG